MPNANPGGPGGRRKRIQTNIPRGRTSHRAGGTRSRLPLILVLLVGLLVLLWAAGVLG